MYLTEKLACLMASKSKSILNFDDETEEVIIYGAINLLQTINAILLIIVVGAMLGVLYETVIVSVSMAILRKYSGGVHASSPARCLIIGTSISAIMGLLTDKISYRVIDFQILLIILVATLISYIIIRDNAPLDSESKPINDIETRNRFKQKSILIVVLYTGIMLIIFILNIKINNIYLKKTIHGIAFGMVWQSITLNKMGVYIFNKIDLVLRYMMEGGKKNERKYDEKSC